MRCFVQKVEFDVLSRAQIENDLIIDILDDLNGIISICFDHDQCSKFKCVSPQNDRVSSLQSVRPDFQYSIATALHSAVEIT